MLRGELGDVRLDSLGVGEVDGVFRPLGAGELEVVLVLLEADVLVRAVPHTADDGLALVYVRVYAPISKHLESDESRDAATHDGDGVPGDLILGGAHHDGGYRCRRLRTVEGVDGIGAPLVLARSRRALLRADLDSVAKDRYLYLYWVVGAFGERAVCVRGSEDSRAV